MERRTFDGGGKVVRLSLNTILGCLRARCGGSHAQLEDRTRVAVVSRRGSNVPEVFFSECMRNSGNCGSCLRKNGHLAN